QGALGTNQVLATIYDDLRDDPQTYLNNLLDFIGAPRFTLSHKQSKTVHSSEAMTHPRSYYRTRNATRLADWFKARRFDKLVAVVRSSPLRRFFLGGGPPFADLAPEISLRLYELFRPEIEELEAILNRDLSAWKYLRARPLAAAG
ncbi:MAG TPA: hypothetical protein VGF08_05600, partial [Terriglobales bacterium]